MPSIEVLINESEEIFRLGLERTLAGSARFSVAACTAKAEECLTMVARLQPDVLLTDDHIAPDRNEVIRRIRSISPKTGTILLKSPFRRTDMWSARRAGFDACAHRSLPCDALLELVEAVYRKDSKFITRSHSRRTDCSGEAIDDDTLCGALTPRERCILDHVSQGETNKRIAQQLDISEKTVKNHMTSILFKLNATDRYSAAELADQVIE